MKKLLFISAIITLIFASCASKKTINGVTYRPYGIFNENTCKNDSVEYEVSGAAVFSGIFFSELLFIPTIYTFGYHLYQPVGLKKDFKNNKGAVK